MPTTNKPKTTTSLVQTLSKEMMAFYEGIPGDILPARDEDATGTATAMPFFNKAFAKALIASGVDKSIVMDDLKSGNTYLDGKWNDSLETVAMLGKAGVNAFIQNLELVGIPLLRKELKQYQLALRANVLAQMGLDKKPVNSRKPHSKK